MSPLEFDRSQLAELDKETRDGSLRRVTGEIFVS